MVASFFTAFDPQLKITVREGKVFDGQNEKIRAVCALPEVSVSTETLERGGIDKRKRYNLNGNVGKVEDRKSVV